MKLSAIRELFLNYFEAHQHTRVASSPLVPHHDPSLMFTAAGMVPFKNYFTGIDTPPFLRATSSQKCLRAGGKHNDLENVGYTPRHHTFFEMLGNFSFGDYFKEEAIFYAWDFITNHLAINPKNLLVTVHASDTQSGELWKKISNLPHDRILSLDSSDNFWTMGDTGPCGPCTEIFFDRGESVPGGPPGSLDEDGPRFTEIWNLVFMQYARAHGHDGQILQTSLPQPCVDTGMGLERISAVMQGVSSNFETDIFQHLIHTSQTLTGTHDFIQSHHVIADHIRASAFLIADGVLPSNEGRGYVLRRIMRRAMRHAHVLGAKDPLMHRMLPALIECMGASHPELIRAQPVIDSTLLHEEEKFRETLDRGMKLLNEAMSNLSHGEVFSGEVAFKLYDTYGFPVDMTADVLRGHGYALDTDGFDQAMAHQRHTARASWVGSGDTSTNPVLLDLVAHHGPTTFLGYDHLTSTAVIKAFFVDGAVCDDLSTAHTDSTLLMMTDQTPFYGESGGQMGDDGALLTSHGTHIAITNTTKFGGHLVLHHLAFDAKNAHIRVGDIITLQVNPERREGLKRHHSATHLLHKALRDHVGDHVIQKGSRVDADRFRFDFTHSKPLSPQEIHTIETLVNQIILNNEPTHIQVCTPEDALSSGAIGLFGEKYGDAVRVVSLGSTFSKELCGGTHVSATGEIGSFKIISESGIASGIRRIEAVVGKAALAYYHAQSSMISDLASQFKTSPAKLFEKLNDLQAELKTLHQTLKDLKKKSAQGDMVTADMHTVAGIPVLCKNLVGLDAKDLKPLMDDLKKQINSGIVVLTNIKDEKVSIVLGITDDMIQTHQLNAGSIIRELSPIFGGKGGGGRADLAQAGGSNAEGIHQILPKLTEILSR